MAVSEPQRADWVKPANLTALGLGCLGAGMLGGSWVFLQAVGAIVTLGGAVWLLWASLRLAANGAGVVKQRVEALLDRTDLVLEDLGPADVPELLQLFEQLLPRDAYPSEERLSRMHADRGTKAVVVRDRRKRKLVGFFIVIALSKQGVQRLRDGAYLAFGELRQRDKCSTMQRPHGLYVNTLGGVNGGARAAVLGGLMMFLGKHPGLPVFARAATRDGRRLMDRWAFRPLPNGSRVEMRPSDTTPSD